MASQVQRGVYVLWAFNWLNCQRPLIRNILASSQALLLLAIFDLPACGKKLDCIRKYTPLFPVPISPGFSDLSMRFNLCA